MLCLAGFLQHVFSKVHLNCNKRKIAKNLQIGVKGLSTDTLEQDSRVPPGKHGRVSGRVDALLGPVVPHGADFADEEEGADPDKAHETENNFEQHFDGN